MATARHIFSRDFKLEPARLVQEHGVSIAQANRSLGLNYNVLTRWIREMSSDPIQAFPGRGQVKADQLEVEKLRREVVRLWADRDMLKKSRTLLYEASEVRFSFIAKHRSVLACGIASQIHRRLPFRLSCLGISGSKPQTTTSAVALVSIVQLNIIPQSQTYSPQLFIRHAAQKLC